MRLAHCDAESQCMSVRLPALKKSGPSPLPIKLYRCARDILKAAQNSGTVKATLSIVGSPEVKSDFGQDPCRNISRNCYLPDAFCSQSSDIFCAARNEETIGMGIETAINAGPRSSFFLLQEVASEVG